MKKITQVFDFENIEHLGCWKLAELCGWDWEAIHAAFVRNAYSRYYIKRYSRILQAFQSEHSYLIADSKNKDLLQRIDKLEKALKLEKKDKFAKETKQNKKDKGQKKDIE